MSATTLQPPEQRPHQRPAERFAAIVEMLRRAVAARGAKGVMAIPLQILLWRRLGRMIRRFAALAARVAAGTLPKPRLRPGRKRPAAPRPATPALRLPRRFAWLTVPVPEANIVRSQLEYLLAQPDMAALLAAPQAGRILRPLCHMLGLAAPPGLARARKPAPARLVASPGTGHPRRRRGAPTAEPPGGPGRPRTMPKRNEPPRARHGPARTPS